MKVSALMTTFGRVRLLQTALRDFLEQDYPDRQLVIVNSCVEQNLVFEHPLVKIINLDVRPPSLGACRNIAVEAADGDVLVTWDDDDRYMTHHLSGFAFAFGDPDLKPDWVWQQDQWFSERGKIIKTMNGSYNTFAFRRQAWETAGKYNELSVGEDKNFVSRVTSMCEGIKISLPDDKKSFIYGWATGDWHISGLGEDKPGIKPAYERAKDDLDRKLKMGIEPTGVINLVPADAQDLTLLVKEFMDAENQKNDQKLPVCIVELGRYGDICNILPICKHIAENYARPHLMVAREFESILEGVSYVIPEIVDLPYDRLDSAMQMAQRRFPIVLRGQIWGKGHVQDKQCSSYNEESWRSLGFLKDFHNPDFEVVFDRRDMKREAQLVSKLATDKPMLLVQVTGSISSPFPNGPALLKSIQDAFGASMNIVDLGTVRAEKIYDVIGLMDKAVAMVAIDTAVLHLAAASSIPVVAIVNPLPWAGSVLRCNQTDRMTYTEAENNHNLVIEAIGRACLMVYQPMEPKPVKPPPRRRLFHLVDIYDSGNIDIINRERMAGSSWDLLYATGKVLPAHFSKYPRTAKDIGDKRALPYLKDALSFVMEQMNDDDICMWSNADNILHTELPDMVMFYASVYDAVSTQRVELHRALPMRVLNPVEMAKNAPPHIGRDLFAFKKSWLINNWSEIGDFILAASSWDIAMTALIRLYHGIKSDRPSFLRHIFPAEMCRGYVFHVAHPSRWNEAGYVDSSPANKHNNLTWRKWAENNLPDLKFNDHNCI